MTINEDMDKGPFPSQHGSRLPNEVFGPEFTPSDIEGLVQDRKRFLIHNYITTGLPLTTTYQVKPHGAPATASATAETFQSSEMQESTITTHRTEKSNIASMDPSEVEVESYLFCKLKSR